MKISKKLLQKYNQPETLLAVSLYPKKGELYSSGTSGVASYTKNIASNLGCNVVVLADYKSNPKIYEEGDVLVSRCFKRGSLRIWIDVLKQMRKFSKAKKAMVHFDFSIYGSIIASALMIPFLFLLKIFGYQIFIVCHHVILDVKKLAGHIGLGDGFFNKLKCLVFNKIFHLFYKTLGQIADKIIVLEEGLKQKLGALVNGDKITAIPHVVDTGLIPIAKKKARRLLGINEQDYVVLFFGYVNWFKGADFFVETFGGVEKFLGKKTRLILAGGKSPTMANKKFYKEYFDKVVSEIKHSKNIEITGHVPQDKIKLYFSATDLVVFPYRNFMCASGVLSLIFSYQTPFIMSEELVGMLEGSDFKLALDMAGLRKEDLVFKLNKKSCLKATEEVLEDGVKEKMVRTAGMIRSLRSLENTAWLYEKTLGGPDILVKKALALSYTGSDER